MLLLLAGLSTGHKVGLAVVGVTFIVFALSVSFLAPRRWPDFPGKNGMSVFVIASLVLFVGMVSAVLVFGRESEPAKAAEIPAGQVGNQALQVQESEFKIQLPAAKSLQHGNYTFTVHNAGKIPHDLAIQGPGLSGTTKTALISAGGNATLKVTLQAGSYTLWCTVTGHRALGMVAKLTVG